MGIGMNMTDADDYRDVSQRDELSRLRAENEELRADYDRVSLICHEKDKEILQLGKALTLATNGWGNWKYEAQCEHDHAVEFSKMNDALRAELDQVSRERDAAVESMKTALELIEIEDKRHRGKTENVDFHSGVIYALGYARGVLPKLAPCADNAKEG